MSKLDAMVKNLQIPHERSIALLVRLYLNFGENIYEADLHDVVSVKCFIR